MKQPRMQVTQSLTRWLERVPRPAARWSRLFALAVVVGALSGTASAALEWSLHYGSELLAGRFAHLGSASIFQFHWGVLALPMIGGLASGIIVQLFFREPFGHGTDLLTHAFHRDLGAMPLKGPAVKAAAAIGVISCGGSAGPEGPVAALGASLGSVTGKLVGITPRERRILLVAGCAAGIGAVFRCPLGGALFAAGILYREPEFESEAIVPGFVASVIGYSTFMFFQPEFGEPLFGWANFLRFQAPIELIPYAILGPLCGLTAIFFTICVRAVERHVRPRLPVAPWLKPAAGGLIVGGLACLLPQVMDGRYLFIRNALDGALFDPVAPASWWWWTALFGAVAVAKCVASALTVGTGASGGVLGPSVFIGGAVGAFLGALMEALLPTSFPETLREALIPVGMAGVLAAGMRTPLAAIVMVAEMTGGYGLIVPLMLVSVSAYVVGRRWGLNEEQVRSAADSPAHAADGLIHLLESLPVTQFMESDWQPTVTPGASLGEMIRMIEPGTRPVFAVMDDGRLVGVVSVPDIRQIMEEPGLAEAVVAADIMSERLATIRADDDLYQALHHFGTSRHDVLPVVSPDSSKRWVGMLTRRRVFDALQQRIVEASEVWMREHAGLRAIDHEGQLQQLMMAVSPIKTDRIQRLMVPLDALDRTIREADMRRRFGIEVLGVELPDGSVQFPPDIDTPLKSSHRLVGIVMDDTPTETSGEDADAPPGDGGEESSPL